MPFTDEEVNALNAQEGAYPLEFFKGEQLWQYQISVLMIKQKSKQL